MSATETLPVQRGSATVADSFEQKLLYICDPNDPLWHDAFMREANDFIDAGYVNDLDEHHKTYDPYDDQSRFLVVERQGKVIGTSRVIVPGEQPLKTMLDVVKGYLNMSGDNISRVAQLMRERAIIEVGTFSLDKTVRGSFTDPDNSLNCLYAGIIDSARLETGRAGDDEDPCYAVASFDHRFFELFRRMFGPGIEALGKPVNYMGSPTIPALMDIPKILEHDLQRPRRLLQWVGRMATTNAE